MRRRRRGPDPRRRRRSASGTRPPTGTAPRPALAWRLPLVAPSLRPSGDSVIIKGYRVETLAKCVGKEVLGDDVLGLSAELAYYFFFSLFPIMLFITPMLSFFGNEQEIVNGVLAQLGTAIPPDAQRLVADVVRSVVTTNAPGLMS